MELKAYQRKVIKDLEEYLDYLQKYNHISKAFKQFWENKIGAYNPLNNTGMQPYKHTVPKAVHLTMKVPTAGGKTFIAVNALRSIFNAYDANKSKAVVWLVPWSNLLDQTVENLRNPDHPYRQKLNTLFNHRVEVYEKQDLLQGSNFTPTTVKEQLTIVVMSFASLRARKKEDRKVFQENGQLATFATQYQTDVDLLEEVDETALINVIRSLNPVLVVDESHNAESNLSVEMLQNLNPSFILDLTATPKDNSNLISIVPAFKLKQENMVKLPVIVYNHPDKTEVINSALHLQRKLEILALQQEKQGGKYIRPIVLFQAQSKTNEDNTTFEKIKKQLLELKIPEEQIKIKTAEKNELKGIDLMNRDCPVRYIITINALKEGWDCPFAYILASLADKSSAVDVEQILGRILRQPYVMKHHTHLLNSSYVLTASSKFLDTLKNIVKGLEASGFSADNYRAKDIMPMEEDAKPQKVPQGILFPELLPIHEAEVEVETEDEVIDTIRISFDPNREDVNTPIESDILNHITQMAEEQNAAMEERISYANQQTTDENLFEEMGDRVKRYAIKTEYKEVAQQIKLPHFYLKVPSGKIFDTHKTLLNSESLLKNFSLSKEDIKINFEELSSEIFAVDTDDKNKNATTITQIEDSMVKDPLIEYILAKPKDKQVKDVTHDLMNKIGNMFPIPDQEIRKYITRILDQLNTEQLRDILSRPYTYRDKIKKKIQFLADSYAETEFNDLIKIGKIHTAPTWELKNTIVPGKLSSSIAKSLYEREGDMNDLEQKIILSLTSMPNIFFWHRNLEKGKGFPINGFKSNHYPDFILVTESNNVVLLETKGDHLVSNSDSAAKARLGNKWATLAGNKFHYFMVYEGNKTIEGAYKLEKAKELIRQL